MRPMRNKDPLFTEKDGFEVDPNTSPRAVKFTKQVFRRYDIADRGVQSTGMSANQFEEFYSALASTFHRQTEFLCLAVDPPSEDGRCEVTLHNSIPALEENGYKSPQAAVVGKFELPGVQADFPGMIMTTKTAVFGDPAKETDDTVISLLGKSKPPKANLRE